MNTIRTLTLALGVAAVLAAPALAQRQGGQGQGRFGMGIQGSLVGMLMAEPVREELDLTDEQAEQLQPIVEKVRGEMTSRMQEMRDQLADLSDEERRERFEQMSRELNAMARQEVTEILKPEQLARLEQIQLQQQGVQGFSDPRVAQKLNLSAEQKSQLNDIVEAERAEVRAMMEQARDADNPVQAFGRLGEVRRESMEKARAVLTEEQQSTWKELTGDPFEMPRGAFGRGGRPGGPGGGRPNNN